MAVLQSICVYCGSRAGSHPGHAEAARRLGTLLGERRLKLVFGGGGIGLMGVVANAVLRAGGTAVGVIPRRLHDIEIAHDGVGDLRIVESMHERKQMMFELADAFVSLPGGLGTLDETFEIVTWRQLGYHDKPVVVVDSAGYWQPFFDLVDGVIAGGFADPQARTLYTVVSNVEDVLPTLDAAQKFGKAALTGLP